MNRLARAVLDRGLELGERGLAMADNAFDWLFLRESLIQSGQTPYEEIFTRDPMTLRFYPPPAESAIEIAGGRTLAVRHERLPVPLVLVPPLGVTTETFDLMPHRSLARYMAARGFHTYLIDWGRPQKQHAHLGFKDYARDLYGAALAQVRRHAGVEEVSLMGWCMGGLLSLIYLGFTQDPKIRNLVTVASPIDLRGGGMVARTSALLQTPARLIRRFTRFRLDKLDPARLHAPAWLTTLGFKLTDPIGSITTYWDLVSRLWDRDFVASHSTTSDYLNRMLLYPGGVVQDMVVKMAVDNQLAGGRIEIRGEVADLTTIRANFLAWAGTTDHLVPADVARQSVDLLASTDKEFRIAVGGHMGVILGSKAVDEVWEPTAQWLETRSQLDAPMSESGAERSMKTARRRQQALDPTL